MRNIVFKSNRAFTLIEVLVATKTPASFDGLRVGVSYPGIADPLWELMKTNTSMMIVNAAIAQNQGLFVIGALATTSGDGFGPTATGDTGVTVLCKSRASVQARLWVL